MPLPRARVRSRADSRRRGVGGGRRRSRIAPAFGARWRSAVSSAWTSTRWPCSSPGCRSGWPRSRATGPSRSWIIICAPATASSARRSPTWHGRREPRGPGRADLPLFELDAAGGRPRRDHRTPPVDRERSRRHHRAGSREGAADGVAGAGRSAARAMEGRRGFVVRRLVPRRPGDACAAPRSGLSWTKCSAAARSCRAHVSAPLVDAARRAVERERFFHWTLEFPEVFHDADGRHLPGSGFDAVLGNPPWEMLRGDRGAGGAAAARTDGLHASVRRLQPPERRARQSLSVVSRARALARPHRRPPGHRPAVRLRVRSRVRGAAAAACWIAPQVDTFISIENRDGLFPIHRGLKFLLIAATPGQATTTLPCRFGVRSPDVLDELPDAGADPSSVPIPRSLVDQLTGEQLAIPELRTADDVAIASRIAFSDSGARRSGWMACGVRTGAQRDGRQEALRRAAALGRPGTFRSSKAS